MMLSKSTCYTLLALLPFATKEPASYLKKEEILSQSMQLYCNTAHPDFCRQTKGGYLSSGQKALEWAIQQASTVQLLERISWGHYTLTQRGMWYLEDFSQQMALQETLQQEPLFPLQQSKPYCSSTKLPKPTSHCAKRLCFASR